MRNTKNTSYYFSISIAAHSKFLAADSIENVWCAHEIEFRRPDTLLSHTQVSCAAHSGTRGQSHHIWDNANKNYKPKKKKKKLQIK